MKYINHCRYVLLVLIGLCSFHTLAVEIFQDCRSHIRDFNQQEENGGINALQSYLQCKEQNGTVSAEYDDIHSAEYDDIQGTMDYVKMKDFCNMNSSTLVHLYKTAVYGDITDHHSLVSNLIQRITAWKNKLKCEEWRGTASAKHMQNIKAYIQILRNINHEIRMWELGWKDRPSLSPLFYHSPYWWF